MDIALIAHAKRSVAYRAIRSRIADPTPADSWYDEHLAFVVFDLDHTPPPPPAAPDWGPQVIFVLAAETGVLLAARVVEPGAHPDEPRITDLAIAHPA